MIHETIPFVPGLETALDGSYFRRSIAGFSPTGWNLNVGSRPSGCGRRRRNRKLDDCANRFYTYGVVAGLAMLAAARERNNLPDSTVLELKSAQQR